MTKVSELSGRKLDEWVARAEGHHVAKYEGESGDIIAVTIAGRTKIIDGGTAMEWLRHGCYHPSTDPKEGQPIMERLKISPVWGWGGEHWNASNHIGGHGEFYGVHGQGPTMLIAGMRVRVAMVYGEEVPA